MKIAIIGSEELTVSNLEKHLPKGVTEIVSDGAGEIAACAAAYAKKSGLSLTEFLPEYEKYSKQAPLIRNIKLAEYADLVLAFWDGQSNDTEFVIETCRALNKPVKICLINNLPENQFTGNL